ncbi:MAG: flagellar biosynthesis protein FlhA [Ignavibacteriales bacterium]|nr:flagellar biosynthesis protein FlhA [Ignavibacteriales bacterium]
MTRLVHQPSLMERVGSNTDVLLAVGVLLICGLLVVPLPSVILDVLLALNITIAILILIVSMYIKSPIELSVFPSLLLVLTIFRLSLNVAATRLVLGEGYAGEIIHAFGSFIVKGNYVVGFVIFLILVLIQFIVIVKGAGRIAEVAARFTLDGMPGKQMAIDADMNAGLINESEARQRRADVAREAEFFGAMDGASKFVKGDAIAGLLINIVNIIGGFVIGMAQRGLSFSDALKTYTLLTVGDGLVTQIPALLIATAAGMVVTRSGSGEALDREVRTQIFGKPKALLISSGALCVFAIVPGLPAIPFLILSGLSGTLGYVTMQQDKERVARKAMDDAMPAPAEKKEDSAESYVQVDPLELEIGYGLIALVDDAHGGDLFSRITGIRKQLAMDLGIVIPSVRVRDNLQLSPNQYVIKIRGNLVATNELAMDRLLAMKSGPVAEELDGVKVQEPAFNLPAVWVPMFERERAELSGYTVVEPPAVLSTHLQEVLRRNADKIIGRQETRKLIDNLKKEYPAVVDELTPELLPTGTVQKVLQNLLREGIPIRDLVSILESLIDYARVTKNVDVLTEYVRHSLSESIAHLYQDSKGVINCIVLGPRLEQLITSALQNQRESSPSLGLSPAIIETIHRELTANVVAASQNGYQPVVLCAATVRPYFYRLIHTSFPTVAVLSFTELPAETEIEFIGKLELDNAN